MSAGVLIYCFNSEKVKYHTVTNFSIQQIKLHLKLPVTVVTNKDTQKYIVGADNFVVVEHQKGNRRVYRDQVVDWFNLERSSAYDYTPYETTILLDSDYFVYTNNLLQYVNTNYDFLLHNLVYDLTDRDSFNYKNESLIPLVWATVTIFKKNNNVKNIFNLIKHIQKNYFYYYDLYRIDVRNFRNDYAFAIAMHQLSIKDFIPTCMSMLPADTEILHIDNKKVIFKYQNKVNKIFDHDVHVLQKEIPVNV